MSLWAASIEPVIMHPSFAGLLGCLLYIGLNWDQPLRHKLLSIIGCMACVFYFAPVMVMNAKVFSTFGPPIFGFICGLLGMDTIVKLRAWWNKLSFEQIISFFTNIPAAIRALMGKQ